MDDEPPDSASKIESDTGIDVLTSTKSSSQLEKISSEIIFNKFEECPNFYKKCPGADATCMGDMNKPRACIVFFEKNLTAPPKGIDCNNNVLEQLQRKKQHYENLNQACIDKRTNLEQAKHNYEQALKDLSIFKEEYFI